VQIAIGLFLFVFGIVLWAVLHKLGNAIQQREFEKERFAMMVAQELDRLDKAVKENNRMIANAEAMLEPQVKWWGRN